jgi:hypothetical protein
MGQVVLSEELMRAVGDLQTICKVAPECDEQSLHVCFA